MFAYTMRVADINVNSLITISLKDNKFKQFSKKAICDYFIPSNYYRP